MRPRSIALALTAVVVVGGFGIMRAGAKRPPAGAAPVEKAAPAKQDVVVPVEVTTVERGTIVRTLSVTGSLKTDRDVHITSKLPGKVANVAVKEGDRVRVGQLLLALDDADQRAQLAQAQAGLRSAQERLSQAKSGEAARYTQADAQIEQTEANLQAARVRVQQMETNARMTDASAKAAVSRAESGLATAKDRLRITREGARQQERRVAENAVEQARVSMGTAKARLDRRRRLFDEGAISREELDETDKMFRLAEAQYNSAVQQRDLVQEGARSEEVRIAEEGVRQAEDALREAKSNLDRNKISAGDTDSARQQVLQLEAALKVAKAGKAQYDIVPSEIAGAKAAVDEARARVQFAQEQLKYLRITSPVDGVVATCTVNVGESIGTGTQLMNVVALNGVYFEAQVPEISLSDVRTGQPVKVSVDSMGDRTLQGTIREMIPVAAADSKTFRVRVAVGGSGGTQLPVGSFARGEVEIGRNTQVLVVPKDCLLSLAGETYVFLVTDGSVHRQGVKLGGSDAANVQVLEGLKEGDRIVVSGITTLSDGAKIKVVDGTSTPAQ